jgi:hypothetical protein
MTNRYATTTLCVLFASAIFGSVSAEEKTTAITQLTTTGTDLINAIGLDVYKFRVPLRSKSFSIAITEQDKPDADSKTVSKFDFKLNTDADSFDVLLSFLPTDGAIRNTLLSADERIDFSIFCESGEVSTMTRNEIRRPLSRLSTVARSVAPMTLKKHEVHSTGDTICLISISGHDDTKAGTNSDFPVARVCIIYN